MFVNALKLWSWEGRICRRQYLLAFILIVFGVTILAAGIDAAGIDGRASERVALALMFLLQLALIPTQIKRLHDIGWGGEVILLGIIPGINLILGLGLLIFSGTKGPNEYGEDPHTGK